MIGSSFARTPLQQWPPGRGFSADLGRWKVAWLKPRHEKAFADELRAADFPYYLPLVERTHRRPGNGKPKKALMPLFPTYLSFAAAGPTTPLYQTGRIIRILPVGDQERFIEDLQNVLRLLTAGLPVEVHPGLCPGKMVRIVQGPLKGLTGLVERLGDHCRFWINVELFNRSVAVPMPCDHLAPLE